jgi:hypothetical protein
MEVEATPDSQEVEPGLGEDREAHELHVTIHNEDDGDSYRFTAGRHELVARVIRELYEDKLRREPQDDDRLRCEADGQDVFHYSELTFGEYLDAGHCPKLEWLFAGGTGGA